MSVLKLTILLALCLLCGAEKPHLNEALESSNNLAFRLYKKFAKRSSNVFFSPSSISIALASTSLGTKGNTANELSKTMLWNGKSMADIHTGMKEYLDTLRGTLNDDTKARIANRLYANNSVTPLEEYTKNAEKYYGIDLGRLNFGGKTAQSRKQLNSWVKTETNTKVKNFIPDGYLNSNTRLVVVNTLHFNGPWLKGFKGKITRQANFTVNASTLYEVPFMRLESMFNLGVCKKLKSRVIEMFYEGRKFSMIIVLPNDRVPLKILESKINYRSYQDCIATMKEKKVQLFLPRFKLREELQLKGILQELGVNDLFDASKADMSGLSDDSKLKVDEIFHSSFISVGEKGNKARDANGEAPVAGPSTFFKVNRPFMFFIRENAHGSILLMGRVNKPLQNLGSLKKKDKKGD